MTIRLRSRVRVILMDSHPLITQFMDSRKAGNRGMHTGMEGAWHLRPDMELGMASLVQENTGNISKKQNHTKHMATRQGHHISMEQMLSKVGDKEGKGKIMGMERGVKARVGSSR